MDRDSIKYQNKLFNQVIDHFQAIGNDKLWLQYITLNALFIMIYEKGNCGYKFLRESCMKTIFLCFKENEGILN